jgi:hypothetical protein
MPDDRATRGGGPAECRCPLASPNDVWCAYLKGEFKLGNGHYCYPLTIPDHASRFLLLCEALESTREDAAITAFEQLFLERGLYIFVYTHVHLIWWVFPSRIVIVNRRPTPFFVPSNTSSSARAARELPVDLSNQFAQLQTFRHGLPCACSAIGQPSRILRTSVPVLPTSLRLLIAVSFLIAASIRPASDWFRQQT